MYRFKAVVCSKRIAAQHRVINLNLTIDQDRTIYGYTTLLLQFCLLLCGAGQVFLFSFCPLCGLILHMVSIACFEPLFNVYNLTSRYVQIDLKNSVLSFNYLSNKKEACFLFTTFIFTESFTITAGWRFHFSNQFPNYLDWNLFYKLISVNLALFNLVVNVNCNRNRTVKIMHKIAILTSQTCYAITIPPDCQKYKHQKWLEFGLTDALL